MSAEAWGAACHADWISQSLDELVARYNKLQKEDGQLAADIKDLEGTVDYHTVDNRDKRKSMQERRNAIAKDAETIAKSAQQGRRA